MFDWRMKFSCFNCGPNKLPLEHRVKAFQEICKAEKQDEKSATSTFKSLIPAAERLWPRHENNKAVWIELCEGLRDRRKGKFLTEKQPFLECAFSYLCFLDESNEVEKNFVVLQEAEYKKRERHCSMQSLSDILRICIGIPESIDMLVTRVARENGTCEFAPKTLIQKAQDI